MDRASQRRSGALIQGFTAVTSPRERTKEGEEMRGMTENKRETKIMERNGVTATLNLLERELDTG